MMRRAVLQLLAGAPFARGDGLRRPVNAPQPQQVFPGVQPGVSNAVTVTNQVIVVGPGPSGGIFVYSGQPASGNLLESIGITSGTTKDPYSLNAVLPGDTRYHNNGAGVFVAQQSTQSYVAYLWQAASALGPYSQMNTDVGFTNEFTSQPILQLVGKLGVFISPATGPGVMFVAPSGDTTGATDSANLVTALSEATVALMPSTYYLNAPLSVSTGLDMGGATVQPGSGWAGSVMITLGSGSFLKGGTLFGGSGTRSANPATDAITLAAGATRVHIEGVTCNFMNGFVLNATVTAAAHCSVAHLIGLSNAGGIKITAASTGISAQYNVSDVNLQACEVSEALLLQHVFDILVSQFNSSVLGSAGVSTVHLLGKCTSCYLHQMDCGVSGTATAGIPVLHLEDNSAVSVSDCRVSDSLFQQGGIGIAVDGGTARCQFTAVAAKGNAGDGWQFNGTGSALAVVGCYGNTNLGTADVNVTSTAHVGLDLFQYDSTGVTNSLVVPVTNHVTNSNPTSPGGKAVSGTPGGW